MGKESVKARVNQLEEWLKVNKKNKNSSKRTRKRTRTGS